MCGRFTATFKFSDIRVRWNLDRDLPLYKPRFNIAPETSPNIPVIVRQGGGNECRLMHWELIPHWAADPSIGNRMINTRAETVTELPSFKPLGDRRRCVIPADGFYVAQGGDAQSSNVGLPQEPTAVRTGWSVGRMAQAGWEPGGVIHHHHNGAQ
jgi:putative SOS response-associated peptidase YedK